MLSQTTSFREQIAEFIAPEIKERRNLLERASLTDALTNLPNRAAFNKAKNRAEIDPNISFIVFDLNNFGKVNKEVSFSFGDEILSVIAGEIARAAKANRARAFRLGGDEFVVLADKKRARFLRDAIERKVLPVNLKTFVVSISGTTGATFEEADALLQARKAARKARNL